MSETEHLKVGRMGEAVAEEMLKEEGCKIIQRNRKSKYGETDIIAEKGEEVIFAEVRSKVGSDFGLPEESVDSRKIKRLIRNAENYINYKKEGRPCRIDVIGIVFNKEGEVIRKKHYKNITLY